jgi:prevent-host-death family protein
MKIDEYVPVSLAKGRLLEVLRQLEKHHGKIMITKNGLPKAVLISYEDFEGLLETIDILADAETVKGIRQGLKDIKAGKMLGLEETFKD